MEEVILNASPSQLLRALTEMNLLHMNDSTRAMLRDKYPEVYRRVLEAQYDDAEKRLVTLLKQSK